MSNLTHTCLECGNRITEARKPKMFCSTPCRQTFNNRRMQRGAQLYDMFMAMRYERKSAEDHGAWAIMCRMAMDFRREDDLEREGRKSWQPIASVIDRLPVTTKSSDVTIIRDFTGRGRIRSGAAA